MLLYVVGLAAAGLVGSFVFQGPQHRTLVRNDAPPDVKDYQIPSLEEEEANDKKAA